MALANFIDRAATSASQVLARFQLEKFKTKLSEQTIGVVFDQLVMNSKEAWWTAELTVNLLARLYPRLALCSVDGTEEFYVSELSRVARSINPLIEIRQDLAEATVCVVVGETIPLTRCATFYLGSAGWRAKLSATSPVGSGSSTIPYGAGAAACFGVANVFRWVFADQIEGGGLDHALDLSLFDFSQNGDGDFGPELGVVNLGQTLLVGVGAIGNAALWSLKRTARLEGELHLIDHETIELSNLQRYVLLEQKDDGLAKVDVGCADWPKGQLALFPHPTTWKDYVAGRQNWTMDRVAIALDTVSDRISIQGALPRRILNSWTQELDLGISRHGFGDGGPCLCCLYLPTGKTLNEHELIAEALRISSASDAIKTMLQLSTPVDAQFVHAVAEAFEVEFDALRSFVGQPVRTFYQRAICGGLIIALTGGSNKGVAVVPMSFQSALAGILLAAEIVKDAAGIAQAKTPITRVNLLRPIAAHLNDPRAPDQTGRCLCADEVYLDRYREKYGVLTSS